VRTASSILVGLALALLVVGVSLYPLTHPTVTRLLVERYALFQQIGLSEPQVEATAEQVRAFVTDAEGQTLPATVGGRPGFDAAAVAHLVDVRNVISGARTVTGVLAALVAAWLVLAIALRRFDLIPPALFAGAAGCAAIVLFVGMAGFLNFEALFTWFHGLFFSAGTWEFPADSLLIQVFPEAFWAAAAAGWAALILLGGGILATASMLVRAGVDSRTPGRRARDSSAIA
jgi:integral membrane protein (TIGR01906 family)